MTCAKCGNRAYGEYCFRCKPRKPLPKTGKEFSRYEHWKKTVAVPYLDAHYGHVCTIMGCSDTKVDIDHIKTRGGHPELKYNLTNIRYLCRQHHRQITDGIRLEMKHE